MREAKKNKTRYLLFSFCLSVALVAVCLCGCSQEGKTTDTGYHQKDNLYVLARNNQWGILNAQGEFVIEPQSYQLRILRDNFTHAPKYIAATKIIPGEKDEEWGGYWDNEYQSALYDTKGNLIYDFAPGYFSDVFGDYLSMYQGEKHQLMNMKTQETADVDLEEDYITYFGDLIILSSYEEKGIRFYNQTMELVKELPDYYGGYTMKDKDNGKNYFVVQDEERNRGLIDENFNLVVPCKYHWLNGINSNYLVAEDNSQCSIAIDITTGEEVWATDPSESISYYDGAFAVINTYDKYRNRSCDLINLQDPTQNITAPDISLIGGDYQINAAQAFVIRETEENKSDWEGTKQRIIDTKGNEILTINGQCWVYGDQDYIAVEYYGTTTRPVELYKLDGTQIPLPKDYLDARRITVYEEATPYLQCGYRDNQDNWRIDILDLQGNILVEHLQTYAIIDFEDYYCDGYRILARKGFSQGMLDMKGNWLYKESMFNSFGNEF